MAAALPTVRGYRILHSLGEGGMGRVFLAEDETLQRKVAIKMIAGPLLEEGAARTRFLREARAMAGVEHPNVVRVYAFGEADGHPYIVMEYVDGETLGQRLVLTTRLAVDESLHIAREVARALSAAWARGIVHRDVKPANILLDREHHVKVADFGLARPAPENRAELTGVGMVVGSPHYISPEQARGEETDFRSDVYSLGVVLYEMLDGEKPFTARSPVEVMAKHLSEPLPRLGQRRPFVPPAVVSVVESMTAKSREDRPGSYPELLESLTPSRPMPAAVESATSSMPTLARPRVGPRPRGRRRAWLALAVALVLAMAVGLVLGRWKTRHGSFTVAVAPFYGADAESEKEGRVLTSLIEGELTRRLPEDDVDVLGVSDVRKVVRSPRGARTLAVTLDVDVLVWGEALVFQGQVEIAPRVTRRDGTLIEAGLPGETLAAGAPNAIELRRARARAVADKVAEIYEKR